MAAGKKYQCIRVAVVLLLFCAMSLSFHFKPYKAGSIFFLAPADTLNCAIAIEPGLHSPASRNVGFNYELLGAFGSSNSSYVRIEPPQESPQCWEDLLSGKCDILVFNLKDSIPEEYRDRVTASVPVKDNDVWITAKDRHELLSTVNFWFTAFQTDRFFQEMSHRYFRSYNIEKMIASGVEVTALSPYDDLIKKYSSRIGMDWRLLSAIVYQESTFAMGLSSSKSAKGLMQVKESTAARYGIDNLYDPDQNVKAGTMYFNHLLKMYREEGLDSVNVIKFALASYNAGENRIREQREAAAENGYNPDDWDSILTYFNRWDGPTNTYITEILDRYETYKAVID